VEKILNQGVEIEYIQGQSKRKFDVQVKEAEDKINDEITKNVHE